MIGGGLVAAVVAVILGALFLAEPITPRTVVAAAVIVVAVALIVTARGRLPAPQPAAAPARERVAGARPTSVTRPERAASS